VSGGRNVVKKKSAQGAVDEIEGLEMPHVFDGDDVSFFFHDLGDVDIGCSSGSKLK
jgi:hypothetical protein